MAKTPISYAVYSIVTDAYQHSNDQIRSFVKGISSDDPNKDGLYYGSGFEVDVKTVSKTDPDKLAISAKITNIGLQKTETTPATNLYLDGRNGICLYRDQTCFGLNCFSPFRAIPKTMTVEILLGSPLMINGELLSLASDATSVIAERFIDQKPYVNTIPVTDLVFTLPKKCAIEEAGKLPTYHNRLSADLIVSFPPTMKLDYLDVVFPKETFFRFPEANSKIVGIRSNADVTATIYCN